MRKLNNKGFAISVILYTATTLVILILLLILSILSTNTKNKDSIVDKIKESVSGSVEESTTSALGKFKITALDGKKNGEWHTANTTLSFSRPDNAPANLALTYYYGTSTSNTNTKVNGNQFTITENTKGTIYYIKACQADNPTICSDVSKYLLKLDKSKPTIQVVGTSTEWTTSKTLTITSTSTSEIDYYEYYISNTTNTPSESEEFIKFNETTVTINSSGQYIFIRAINTLGVKGNWQRNNLYVSN